MSTFVYSSDEIAVFAAAKATADKQRTLSAKLRKWKKELRDRVVSRPLGMVLDPITLCQKGNAWLRNNPFQIIEKPTAR